MPTVGSVSLRIDGDNRHPGVVGHLGQTPAQLGGRQARDVPAEVSAPLGSRRAVSDLLAPFDARRDEVKVLDDYSPRVAVAASSLTMAAPHLLR